MNKSKYKKFRLIALEYEKTFWRIAITYESDLESQKELLQEIMLAVWKSLSNFKNKSNIQTYLYRVAHNTAFRHVQTQSKSLRENAIGTDLPSLTLNPEHLANSSQQFENIMSYIRRLPINQRQILALSLDDLSYAQIADITGMSITNVGAQLSRAKKSLSKYLRLNDVRN